MIDWKWRPERTAGIWRHGAGWLRPILAAVPYLTVLVLLLMLLVVTGTLTVAKGTLFDLPEGSVAEGEATELVALVMPARHETVVLFDDTRYVLDDVASLRFWGEHLAERAAKSERKVLLVMADRRVSSGNLMKLASIVRQSGIRKVLFAEKGAEGAE